jgi:hypothetical protein
MNSHLNISSWNVWGLGDPNQATVIKNWACRFYHNLDNMCFQEWQAQSTLAKLNLQALAHDSPVFLDSHEESDRVGSAIIAASHVKVLDHGSKGDGTFSWIKVESSREPIYIGLYMLLQIGAAKLCSGNG